MKGKNLDSIKELQNDTLKEIILSEELAINYRYCIRGVSGNYYIILNFSGALVNKPIQMAFLMLNQHYILTINLRIRLKVKSALETELKLEFNKLKKEKLKQFNRI